MIGWRVAIPSAGRAETLEAKTLALLARSGVDPADVDVWVPDDDSLRAYRAVIGHAWSIRVAPHDPRDQNLADVGVRPAGLGRARNTILDAYPRGTRLAMLDDDLAGVVERVDARTVRPVDDLAAWFDHMWAAASRHRAMLWGVYPVPNPYFMRRRVRLDLTYICGGLFGVHVHHRRCERVVLDDKEDFERSIRHYLADGRVLRQEQFALKTAGYTGPGGMQLSRTPERVAAAARWLAATYPRLATLNTTKRSGWVEVRLADRRRRVR